jgi:hypothetical protein
LHDSLLSLAGTAKIVHRRVAEDAEENENYDQEKRSLKS